MKRRYNAEKAGQAADMAGEWKYRMIKSCTGRLILLQVVFWKFQGRQYGLEMDINGIGHQPGIPAGHGDLHR